MPGILPAAVAARWTNQDLILYHGTLDMHVPSIRAGINLGAAPAYRRLDFGHGFYTTTIEGQARAWARRLARRRLGPSPARAAVVSFILGRDDLARLDGVWFVRGTRSAYDFWSLASYCRGGGIAHGRGINAGWYDVVIGPVVASSIRQATIPHSDQVSFHTRRAATLLEAGMDRIMVLEGSDWRLVA